MNLLQIIQFNIDSLKFSIDYNKWDLSPDVQSRMLLKLDEIQAELNRVIESKKRQ